MDPKPFFVFGILIFIIYLFVKREKPLDFYYRARKKHGTHLSHKEYIRNVIEEGNKKEEEDRARAEKSERIKKSIHQL